MTSVKLSIITINLNNVSGLQRTMESVFLQTFTDYEYIIIDGGSCDGSKEEIKKHENKLVYWVSEKDKGIYNAMNKGIAKASGDYLMFMNSGDHLFNDAILGEIFENSNNEDIIYGNAIVDRGEEKYNELKTYPQKLTFKYFVTGTLHHTSSVIRSRLFEKYGLYNEDLKIMADWEFFIKTICLYQASYKYLNFPISCFNPNGISSQIESGKLKLEERQIVLDKYFHTILPNLIELEAENRKAEARLNLYRNSRLHKMVEKIINNPLYKTFKR
jgi:glycosyltransferase involved in cell wall biosynthesis